MNEATRRSFDMAESLANMAGVLLRLQSQLVDDLLDVSRIIAGKTELDLRVLDLRR